MEPTTKNNDQFQKQWIYRYFHSEKIRHIERYRRKIQNKKSICLFPHNNNNSSTRSKHSNNGKSLSESTHAAVTHRHPSHTVVFIPDGLFLRKYLTILEEMIKNHASLAKLSHLKLVLLESAAESMDHRNSSPCKIHLTKVENGKNWSNDAKHEETFYINKETPTSHERNRIVKLCMDNKDTKNVGVEVIPFPDLTLFDHEILQDDDFESFGYTEMSIKDRSKCAVSRAARFFFHMAQQELYESSSGFQQQENKEQETINNGHETKDIIDVVLLTDEETPMAQEGIADISFCTLNMQSMNCNALLSFLSNAYAIERGSDQLNLLEDHWKKLQEKCENEYTARNTTADLGSDSKYTLDRFGHFEYLASDELQIGLQRKKYLKGKLKVTSENCREAYCSIKDQSGITVTYFLTENKGHFNRSINEDTVVIEPLPKSQWEQPIGKKWLIHVENEQEDDGTKVTEYSNVDDIAKGAVPTARVVGLCNNTSNSNIRRQLIATMIPKADGFHRDEGAIVVVPMDTKIPRIRIKTRMDHERILNKRLLVEIDSWNLDSLYPNGHIVKIVGDVGELETEIKCLLTENKVDLSPFSANALACLPARLSGNDSWEPCEDEIKRRRDLRSSCRIFSVDPQGCQDIDDAMHARVLKNGDIEVGVHIADVTQFVALNSALDKEAAKRGTTFYLVDRRFDMLPSILSSNLCSLHGQEDRYAVSVIWTMSPDLEKVKSTWYGRTVIHNIQAMTYEQAHNILHDKEPDDPNDFPPPLTAGAPVNRSIIKLLKKDLTMLTKLARKLRKHREKIGGAVDLSSGERGSELKFVLDNEGNPTRVAPKKELEIHNTIAELMIMSNAFVAATIYKHYPDFSILRIHQKADTDNFKELEQLFMKKGIKFDGSSNKALATTLQTAMAEQNSIQDSLFQSLATRAMTEAQYVCTGTLDEGVELSHYGLGIGMYTHFTSPIRRYADIAVHHLLLASLVQKEPQLKTQTVEVFHDRIDMLPGSNAISVLSGDGLKKHNDHSVLEIDLNEDFLDSLIEGATEQQLLTSKNKMNDQSSMDDEVQESEIRCYKTTELSRICENLNLQNRAAKTSSMQCQRLFLSLYFRKNTDIVPAVIIDLRQNGFIVYIPKYDMKGPVHLVDRNGYVQINPGIVHLPESSGLPPSSKVSIADGLRIFPDGRCALIHHGVLESAKVEVSLPGCINKLCFMRLDVINVKVSCDFSTTTARIPSPRLHLVSLNKGTSKGRKSTHDFKKNGSSDSILQTNFVDRKDNMLKIETPKKSIFSIISSIPLDSNVDLLPMRCVAKPDKVQMNGRVQTLKGRVHYGGFKQSILSSLDSYSNDLKSLTLGDQAKSGNYDASRQIEREATSRIQRKAAEKRNTRRAKRK